MNSRPISVLVALCVLLVPPVANAERRAHGTHGFVRKLCQRTEIARWPAGPSAGSASAGESLRRYWHRGAWALVTTQHRRVNVRGYVLSTRFCPPSDRGRAAMARDHIPTRSRVKMRSYRARSLARPLLRRVCSENVWLRDSPIDRAIGLLWRGDAFGADRSARNPWFGGFGGGHEQRKGWVPRAALCPPLAAMPTGYSELAAGGVTVLKPQASVRCDGPLGTRRLLEVGVRFGSTRRTVRAVLARGQRQHPGPVFRIGEPRSLDRGAVGPLPCGGKQPRTVEVEYVTGEVGGKSIARFTTKVLPDVGPPNGHVPVRAAAVHSGVPWPPPSPGTACDSRPLLRYAHGHEGPVSHRYDARPAVSADGAAVAFDSPLALLPGDRNSSRDVYRWNRGRLSLVSSVSTANGGTSRAPTLSSDGEVVAYETDRPQVGDHNEARDVVVRLRSGALKLVSAATDSAGQKAAGDGRSRAPSLARNGHLIAFESRAGNLVADAPNQGIYVADVGNDDVGPPRLLVADAYRPALSADGRVLVFESRSALVRGDRNKNWDVYALRIGASVPPVLVSARNVSTAAGAGRSLAGVPSSNGRYIAFGSAAPDLVAGDSNGVRDVFRRDTATQRTVLVSRDRCGGAANGYSRYPSISGSGRLVAFDSHAEDLVRVPTHGEGEIFVRDITRARTSLASRRRDGVPGRRTSFSPALSFSGRLVGFPSFASDLSPGDNNRRVDQFLATVGGAHVRRLADGANGSAAGVERPSGEPRWFVGPLGIHLWDPGREHRCTGGHGPTVPVRVRYSARALKRPVREVRVLLQRPGSEAVIDRVVLARARPATTREGTVASSRCRANFDLRYEIMVGATDRAHDHTSVTLRLHARVG